jgi:hypothetical protein
MEFDEAILKIIRLESVSLEFGEWTKIDYVIREDKGENNDSPLIELNSKFEIANMQWIPKIVEYSKIN